MRKDINSTRLQSGFFIPAATMVIDSKITHKHHVLQCFVRAAVYLPGTPNFVLCPLYALVLSGPLQPAATHRRRTVFYGIRPSRSVRPPDLRRPSKRSRSFLHFSVSSVHPPCSATKDSGQNRPERKGHVVASLSYQQREGKVVFS